MKPNLLSFFLLLAGMAMFDSLPASGRQLVQNGGFETGDFTGWTQTGNTGSTEVSSNYVYAHSGTYGALLGPVGSLGYISQSIPTVPGQTYGISMWLYQDTNRPAELVVSWNGTNLVNLTNFSSAGWAQHKFTNVATEASTVLKIGVRDDPYYLALDDISVFRLPTSGSSSAAYTFSTLAGYPSLGSADGIGPLARFNLPFGVAVDAAGNVYVSDTYNSTIRMLGLNGVVSTIAGFPGFPGTNDGVGSAARFNLPYGLTVDTGGSIYVADHGNATVRRITPSGTNWVVTTIAGLPGNLGTNDGVGTNASFNALYGIAVDAATNIYAVDYAANTVRKIAPVGSSWVSSTIATGFNQPEFIAVDSRTNLYLTDAGNEIVCKITPSGANWVVSTLAGVNGSHGSADGTSTARFYYPSGIGLDEAGNVYVADSENGVVRQIAPGGLVTTLAGSVLRRGTNDGTGTNALFDYPQGLAVDHTGKIFVAEPFHEEIRKVTTAGVVTTVAGSSSLSKGTADGVGDSARFDMPVAAAVDSTGNIYVADNENQTIRQITPSGTVTTLAGVANSTGTNDGAGSNARFNYPQAIALDGAGNAFVSDFFSSTIRLVTSAGLVSTIAGQAGVYNYADGTNSSALFLSPAGLAVDGFGNVFVADTYNNVIRKMRNYGGNWIVTTIAGNLPGGSSDGTNGGIGFSEPYGIAVDSMGNLFVADAANYTVRELTPSGTNWISSTLAGQVGHDGTNDGTGTNARFGYLYGLALDSADNVLVVDINNTVRRLTQAGTNWVVNTVGGSPGVAGSADGAGGAALFSSPQGIAVDSMDNLYVADTGNNVIRKGVYSQFSLVNAVPFSQPAANGQITVTLLPPEAGGRWRFPWELAWRTNGETASNLVSGEYPIQFSDVPGYLVVPFPHPVAIPLNGGAIHVTNTYYPTLNDGSANAGNGTLTVNIGPSPPLGAGWRFVGDTTPYLPPGFTTNLAPDNYLIEFAPVGGFATPATLSLQITGGLPTTLQIAYILAQNPPTTMQLPTPVPPGEIPDLADYPFGFNGQLESDVGYGSGVAVATNVVLTAAHLIFNDQTLSYVSQAYWFPQQETGVFAPNPLPAQGWYVLSGYASQRTNDLAGGIAPDQSTPQSRNFDVAALYFQTPVANGGQGGYLSSDETPNQWLSSPGEKLLVGYPVDGSQFGFTNIVPGLMYETGPQPYPLNQASDPVNDQQVYTASWFLSYPGNSGGPLYVELNGYYYPAAVYLGTLFNGNVPYASAVRAIDSNVVSLITLAASLGDSGTNNAGGGVITIIPNQSVVRNPAYLQFTLTPPAAVTAGAGWRLAGDLPYGSGQYTRLINTTNAITVQFNTNVPGWIAPSSQSIALSGGAFLTYPAFYTVVSPKMSVNSTLGIGLMGTSNTSYQIQSRTSLVSGTWVPVSTNKITHGGFNLVLPPPGNHPSTIFYRAFWLTNSSLNQ